MLAGAEPTPGAPAPAAREAHLQQFMAYTVDHDIDVGRQVLAIDPDGCVVGSCLWVPAPGRTAALFAPNLQQYPGMAQATQACVAGALADAAEAEVCLVQAMLDPSDQVGERTFAAAGLARMATLLYMERRTPLLAPSYTVPPGVELVPYRADLAAEFEAAVSASYENTRDCPALSGLRDVRDVIRGHMAVGTFHAELWTLVRIDGAAAGCLLLAEVPQRSALEVAYLGLVPAARGRGLGRLLMQRTLGTAVRRGVVLVSLAVDEGNEPALKLYRRFGLSTVARRLAMVGQLPAPRPVA